MMRIAAALLTLFVCAASARADGDQYGGFEQYADEASLKPFTRDLGGVLGSATFHSARSLGLSGWDVGARGGMQFYPSKGNKVLRSRGVRAFGLPWAQAEIGLPWGIDGVIRGVSYQGLTIAGGGVRYGLLKINDKPWSPQLLVSGIAHSVVHQHFSASHGGVNLVGSMGMHKFTAYAGAGFDRTRLVVRSSLADPTLNGRVVQTIESRFTGGVEIRPWQFTYLHIAYNHLHGQSGGEAGVGIRF